MSQLVCVLDGSSLKNVLEDSENAQQFLSMMEHVKGKGGIFITTPGQFFSACEKAKYLQFHAGNMQRLLKIVEINMLVPPTYAGKIITLTFRNEKGLMDEIIQMAKLMNAKVSNPA